MSGLRPLQRAGLALVLLLTALAGAADYARWPVVARFALAALALAALAWLVSFSAEELGEHAGPGVTGLLQSTFGNLPELFVVVFALQKGELVVAQTALVGSILANALLVLGLVIVVGARRSSDGVMRFSRRLPRDTATLLLLSVFVVVIVGLAVSSHTGASHHVGTLSAVGAACLLLVYVSWVVPFVRSDARAQEQGQGGAPRLGAAPALVLLAIGGCGSAFASDWFVNALAPAVRALSLSQAFAGLVVVGIAGNAVEQAVAIVFAWRGRAELAISVVKNSVAQIAAFLFPALVLVSFALATRLTFALQPLYAGALVLTAIGVAQVTGDGNAAEFEGWALVSLYAVIATLTVYQ